MAITLADVRAGQIDPNTLNDVDRAAVRQELIDERATTQLAEDRSAQKTAASAERQRGLNETVGPQPQRPLRSAETGAFSGQVDPAGIDPAARETVAANRAAGFESTTRAAEGLDRSIPPTTPQFQEPAPALVNDAARQRAQGGPANQALSRDLAPPIDSRTSKQALGINRNRKLAAGVAALGLGAAAIKGMSEFEISPAQVLAGAGVATLTAGGAYTLQQRGKIAESFKRIKAERKEDKASFKREAAFTRDGNEAGAQQERTERDQRALDRKNVKAGALETGVIDSDTGVRTLEPAAPELSASQQRQINTFEQATETFREQKRRAQRTINTSQNPADVAAARTTLETVDASIANGEAKVAEIKAATRAPTAATDAAGAVKGAAQDPLGTADELIEKGKVTFDEAKAETKRIFNEAGFGDGTGKNPEGKFKKIGKALLSVPGKAATGAKTLAGKIAPSKATKAEKKEAKTLSEKIIKKTKSVGKFGGVAGVAVLVDDFGEAVNRDGFVKASDDMVTTMEDSMSDMFTRIMTDENLQERDAAGIAYQTSIEVQELALDTMKGAALIAGAEIPQRLHNFAADLADLVGLSFTDLRFQRNQGDFQYEKYIKPEAFEGFEGRTFRPGIDENPDLVDTNRALARARGETVGLREEAATAAAAPIPADLPADPGELPGRPGERFDPTGTQPSGREITQEPFLEPGGGSTLNIRGLGGGSGSIDVGGATGGPSGFAQRVEESRQAGAFEPVSPERRDEATRDLDRVRRGTTAFRDLAATRLGVPTQFLDAVRSGSMTPREANLAQAKQAASGNLPQAPTAAQQQDFAIKGSQELRARSQFTGERIDAGIRRFDAVGQEVVDAFPGADENRKADMNTFFQSWATGWLPEGKDPADYTQRDLQTVKGHFILAMELADKGEGWVRSINPFAPDITAASMVGRGENMLQSMERDGEWFDAGDDNLLFVGRDSSGKDVRLKIQPEDLHPIAQNVINEARRTITIKPMGLDRP